MLSKSSYYGNTGMGQPQKFNKQNLKTKGFRTACICVTFGGEGGGGNFTKEQAYNFHLEMSPKTYRISVLGRIIDYE